MRGLVFLGAALAAISAAHAQDYPNKPVRAITTLTAGGTSDVFARVLGEQFQKRTGQPIVVENRPGGAMNIGGQACAAAPPDGYTFCLLTIETLAYNQYLFKAPGYDPVKQFEPVTNAFYITAALVVSSELKVKSLNLQEVNAALRVLLRQREQDKDEMEGRIVNNVERLVLPYVEKLKEKRLDDEQRTYLGIMETNLRNVVSPFVQKMASVYSKFTRSE
ncbi:MAG: Bug family tripartite tricarboxylate transporter substrate binding protein, partial [Xanthobacteraceae bacterium]